MKYRFILKGALVYTPIGVINHNGIHMNSGHYACWKKEEQNLGQKFCFRQEHFKKKFSNSLDNIHL